MTGHVSAVQHRLWNAAQTRSRRCSAGSIPDVRGLSRVSGIFPGLRASDNNTLEECPLHARRMFLSKPDFR